MRLVHGVYECVSVCVCVYVCTLCNKFHKVDFSNDLNANYGFIQLNHLVENAVKKKLFEKIKAKNRHKLCYYGKFKLKMMKNAIYRPLSIPGEKKWNEKKSRKMREKRDGEKDRCKEW